MGEQEHGLIFSCGGLKDTLVVVIIPAIYIFPIMFPINSNTLSLFNVCSSPIIMLVLGGLRHSLLVYFLNIYYTIIDHQIFFLHMKIIFLLYSILTGGRRLSRIFWIQTMYELKG